MAMLASDRFVIAVHTSLPSEELLEAAADAYLAAFAGAPYLETQEDRAGFLDRVRRYVLRDGFRLAVASEGDAVIGIGLGVVAHPGDWWRDQVAALLSPDEVDRWLGEAVLEVVHIGVRPESRGQGAGAAILDALVANPGGAAGVLTVDLRAAPAQRLYERAGWQILREGISVAGGPPANLMVKRLSADAA